MSLMKRGDLLPGFRAVLTDGITGDAVDLTTATSIRIIGLLNRVEIIDRAGTPSVPAEGVVTMDWQPADTANSGVLELEVEVTWPGGKIQTFPVNGYLTLHIRDDLG